MKFVTDALLAFAVVATIVVLWLVLSGDPAYHGPGTLD
jgi:hypothetical protein